MDYLPSSVRCKLFHNYRFRENTICVQIPKTPKKLQNSLDTACEKSYILMAKADEEIRIKFVMYSTDKIRVANRL
jgi:hypothetical protein